MNVLVVAAHPDDEVLGCGGTISRLANEGQEVYMAVLGEGITSRFKSREEAPEKLLDELHVDSRKAAALLGAQKLFQYDLPDNRFDTVPLLDVVKIIEDLIEQLRPEAVYTQHGGDLNLDHSITFRATVIATRPMAGCPVKELYSYEVPSSTEWSFQKFEPSFRPNVFVDICDTIEKKIIAMETYESETKPFPHPRSREALLAIAKRWGSVVGLEAAEAFELIRIIK